MKNINSCRAFSVVNVPDFMMFITGFSYNIRSEDGENVVYMSVKPLL